MRDQFAPAVATATTMQTAPDRKPILRIFVLQSASRPLPNFIANIGISLISNAASRMDNAGMKYQVPQMPPSHESGVSATK